MNAESVKARLKNVAVETGRTFQDLLGTYGMERTLYRLSVSEYREKFTLKGGIFLYALYDGDYPRATTDIDLLAKGIGNDIETMKTVFAHIFSITTDDPLKFDLESLEVKAITEFKEYHGVNVSIIAFLDRTRIPVSIDIGFGDVIYPDRVLMDFPVLVSEDAPEVYAYSLYSSIAEKFEAMVSLGYDNSRFKDFYDIYVNAQKYDFDGQTLVAAIKETFGHRGTSLHTIVAFGAEYSNDAIRLSRWKSFVKKKKVSLDVTLPETIEVIKQFLLPVTNAIETGRSFDAKWDSREQQWNDNCQ